VWEPFQVSTKISSPSGEQRALIDIDTFTVLRGQLSPRVLGLVVEWAVQHRAELTENWNLAMRQQALRSIDPLR